MKKFLSIAMFSVAAFAASPAFASAGNIDLSAVSAVQNQVGPVNTTAISVAARVGTVGNNDTVSSTAANIVNNASFDSATNMSASLVNVDAAVTATSQTIGSSLNQFSASIAGTGSAGNNGTLTSVAANLGNNVSDSTKVKMK